MTVQSTSATSNTTTTQSATGYDAFQDLGTEAFLELMITEMQNQDPLNPMDNTEMLEQIGQIREIASNDKLSEALEAVLLGQQLTTASNLIGKTIRALSDQSKNIEGLVERVTIEDGVPKLCVLERTPAHTDPTTGLWVEETVVEHTVSLENVSEVLTTDAEDSDETTATEVSTEAILEILDALTSEDTSEDTDTDETTTS